MLVLRWLEPEAVDAKEFGMAFVESSHSGEGVAPLGDSEVERAFGFGELVLLESEAVGFWVGEFGDDAFVHRKLLVARDSLFDEPEGFVGVGVGPSGIDSGEELARGGCDIDSLVDSSGISAENFGRDPMLPVRFIGVLVVTHIVGGDGDEVGGNVLGDVGSSPDELSGFCAILSAVAARIAEVHPEKDRFIGFGAGDEAVENSGSPVEGLENGVVSLEGSVGFDLLKSLPIELARGLGWSLCGEEKGGKH